MFTPQRNCLIRRFPEPSLLRDAWLCSIGFAVREGNGSLAVSLHLLVLDRKPARAMVTAEQNGSLWIPLAPADASPLQQEFETPLAPVTTAREPSRLPSLFPQYPVLVLPYPGIFVENVSVKSYAGIPNIFA